MRPTRALAVAMLTAVLTLSACAGDGDDDTNATSADSGGDAAAPAPAADAPRKEVAQSRDGVALGDNLDSFNGSAVMHENEPTNPPDVERAIISKGNVQLRGSDVEKIVFDVIAVVDRFAGEITDRETGTDDEGEVRMARLVLRIPAQSYSQAFAALERKGDLVASNSTSEDVTTQLIDVEARIRAQRASLSRVEVLLDRATSIRDIVAIESQLTRRQADLDSLVKRQAFLRDQTSMSTVTVNIQRTVEKEKKKQKKDDDLGFITGLENGAKTLVGFVLVVATIAGVLLPWALTALVIGWPLWVLARRFNLRARIPARTRSDA